MKNYEKIIQSLSKIRSPRAYASVAHCEDNTVTITDGFVLMQYSSPDLQFPEKKVINCRYEESSVHFPRFSQLLEGFEGGSHPNQIAILNCLLMTLKSLNKQSGTKHYVIRFVEDRLEIGKFDTGWNPYILLDYLKLVDIPLSDIEFNKDKDAIKLIFADKYRKYTMLWVKASNY